MAEHTIFISHNSADDAFVRTLRQGLETRGHRVFEDGTVSDPNQPLPTQIKELIDRSDRVVVVVSESAARSTWVAREIRYAAERQAIVPELHIVPLLLDGATAAHLRTVFGQDADVDPSTSLQDYPAERLALCVPGKPSRVGDVIGQLVDRLEGRAHPGGDPFDPQVVDASPADLVLMLDAPGRNEQGRPTATARLAYYASGTAAPGAGAPGTAAPEVGKPTLCSDPFPFTAPLGKIEADDIRFYLERYLITPFGVFTKRKEAIEARFPRWGLDLYAALRPDDPAHAPILDAWNAHTIAGARRFTVQAPAAPRDPTVADNPQNHPAITEILGLPWELLHDGTAYLFNDGSGARVRRFLPGVRRPPAAPPEFLRPPLRVLIVCARPETEGVSYIDHRVSVRPLVEAIRSLGELAVFDFLAPATVANLQATLQRALARGAPYHIVHFDGHGVYDPHGGLGQLVFEAEQDLAATSRGKHLVDAHALGANIANQGVQLFFLEACQSAKSEQAPNASVAGRLLQAGVPSVVAMSHSVLVETARQFTGVFYPALVRGRRVGTAMLEGQRTLARDKRRGYRWEPDADREKPLRRLPLELDDWFVPILYQHRDDPPVLTTPAPPARVQQELAVERELLCGRVPPAPAHAFVGRSRELLAAERLLLERGLPWILFRGEGGEGKTTIAAELARWLVTTRRMNRAAFASVEFADDLRAVLCEWGEQLLPNQFARRAKDENAAFELLVRCLDDRPALLILDNVESILPPPAESAAAGARAYEEEFQRALFARCRALLERSPGSRLVLTSREVPPVDSGFHAREQVLEIGRLGRREGIELVARVLAARQAGGASVDPKALEAQREEEIGRLVELVHGHARALVLLTPELADKGLNATTDELVEIMATMDARAGAGRESSLFASVELGLRRLPPGVRERILPLGVVEGGGCILAVRGILEVDAEECWRLCQTLHSVGLAEIVAVVPDPRRPSDVYLRLDPALAPALLRELRRDPGGEVAARNRWMQAYHALTSFLYRQRSTEIHLAVRLTALELPNLLGALRRLAADQSASPHDVIEVATSLESLTRFLHRPAAQREVARLRASAAATLVDAPWSHAAFVAQHQAIEALWAAGQSSRAVELSRDLLDRSVAAGPQAFPEADYDIALARLTLGRSLEMSGQTAEALEILATAREQFDRLARAGGDEAARMASVCLAESADCLLDAGKLDAAAGLYEEAIRRARDGGRRRSVAVGTGQLGAVRLRQRNYIEALRLYGEAMELFKDLDELKSVATCLHQIGIAHQGNGDPDAAEQHYLRSLAINVQTRTTAGEAGSRLQLGSLYSRMPGRLEDAAVFFQHASDLYVQIEDLAGEGKSRNNLASTLIRLGRHDAARPEITRAIECQSRLGPSAEPWKTWMILANLETAVGDAEAARRARERALRAYADARRQGWQITQGAGAPLCDMAFQVLAQTPQHTAQTQAQFVALAASGDTPPHLKALVAQLVRLLDGVRDDSLWRSPDLHYNDAAEILLLLERLERGDVAGSPAAPEMPADPGLRADPRRSADPDLPADPGPPIAAAAEPSIDQLLDALRAIAAGNNLDLATMSPQERVAFVAQVFLHNAGRTFESLDDAEKRALVAQATHLAERLPPKTA